MFYEQLVIVIDRLPIHLIDQLTYGPIIQY